MINSRTDIKNFILKVEANYPVNNWKIRSIHIWPILRIRLFFYLIDKIESNKKEEYKPVFQKKGFKKVIKNQIKKKYNFLLSFFWFFKLNKEPIVFVGADSHRENYKGLRFNKFFDTLILQKEAYKDNLYLEYGKDSKRQFRKKRVFFFNKALKGFLNRNKTKSSITNYNLVGLDDFFSFLEKENFFEFTKKNSKDSLKEWSKSFIIKVDFFKKTLKKISPQKIIILCYYSDDIMALTAAANQMSIETIEMQHGPQVDEHLCYGSWSSIPKEGYDVLPREYWCWDEYSTRSINKWAFNNKLYKTTVTGNPWVSYWKNKKTNYLCKNYILYTLQPDLCASEQLFSRSLINFIKENEDIWFIRLHPRQPQSIQEIKEILIKNDILEKVNITEATNNPLPLVMSKAKIHITHSSGSALEASSFGVKTVFLNSIGVGYFSELISKGEAFYVDYKSLNFSEKLKEYI